MTLAEKVGQMSQVMAEGDDAPRRLATVLREGRIGSVLNQVEPRTVNEPANVVISAKKIAALKGVSFEEVAKQTTKNARELFRI